MKCSKETLLLYAVTDRSWVGRQTLLEQAEDGVEIADCLYVAFQEDVSPGLIRAKLMRLADCPYVICTEAQQAALERIAEGVAHMGPDADKDEQPEDDGSVVKINCATYTF